MLESPGCPAVAQLLGCHCTEVPRDLAGFYVSRSDGVLCDDRRVRHVDDVDVASPAVQQHDPPFGALVSACRGDVGAAPKGCTVALAVTGSVVAVDRVLAGAGRALWSAVSY